LVAAISSRWVRYFYSRARELRRPNRTWLDRAKLFGLAALDRRLVQSCQARAITVAWYAPDGTAFLHPAFDPYWGRGHLDQGAYEPEILLLLQKVRDIPYLLIDCGANFGYWSAVASAPAMGAHRAVAIEASPVTLRVLQKTAAANAGRFEVLNRAIGVRNGEVLVFEHMLAHAGSRVISVDENGTVGIRSSTFQIETICLDTLLGRYAAGGQPVLVKLDIEGQEIAALNGGSSLLDRDTLLIYEDHGGDNSCHVTAALLARGFDVFWPDVLEGTELTLIRVQSIEDVAARKSNPYKGYNLFALSPRMRGAWRSVLERT
jgi:FkbM family methyltransferase